MFVSCAGLLPLASMTQMSLSPSRLLLNTIFVPSGDQSGSASSAALAVRLTAPDPSAFMTQMSLFPLRLLRNTILVPSGDQAGCLSENPLSDSFTGLLPSAPITQISSSPSRSETNAIFAPSAEMFGSASRAALRLEAIGHEAVATLKKGLASTDAEVRFYAAEALAYLDEADAAPALAGAAKDEPAFRVYALTALSALDDSASYEALRDLLDSDSAETRYGAFRALWSAYRDVPQFRGEALGNNKFSYHAIDSHGPPMIHLTGSFRPEAGCRARPS